jgi:hypothetical protein
MRCRLTLLFALVAAAGCGASPATSSAPGGVVTTETEVETLPYAPPPTTTPTTVPTTVPVNGACPSASQLLAGVYHPTRLQIIDPCFTTGVTVKGFRHETDGDLHIYTVPDNPAALPGGSFKPGAGGYYIVEYMTRDGGHLPPPIIGEHMVVTGSYNLDADHGWNELHPVFNVLLDSGQAYVSGPQYGGSPASDSSSNAAADCRDQNGKPCVGWPGVAGLAGALRGGAQGVQPKGDSTD